MTETTLRAPERPAAETRRDPLLVYFVVGVVLGTIFVKSEVVSWFRIQEMFRFQSVHMYGVLFSAVLVGALSVTLMKRLGVRTRGGHEIRFPSGEQTRPRPHHLLGGIAFGLGWALIGACPGPIFALIGSGLSIMLVGLLGALAGAWTYGLLRPSLPH